MRCTHASWPLLAPAPAPNLPCSNAACTELPISHQELTGDLIAYKACTSHRVPPAPPLVLYDPGEAECKQDQTCHGSKERGNQEGRAFPRGERTCWLRAGIMKLLGRNVSLNEYVQKGGYCSRTSGPWLFAGQHAGLVSPMVSL